MTPIRETWSVGNDPKTLADWFQNCLVTAPGVTAAVRTGETSLDVRSEGYSWWQVTGAIFLFPIGLVFLIGKQRASLLVTVTAAEAGSTVELAGRCHPKALVALQQARASLESSGQLRHVS